MNITIPPNYRMIIAAICLNNLITNQTECLFLIYNLSTEVEVSKNATGTIQKPFTLKDFVIVIMWFIFVFLVCGETTEKFVMAIMISLVVVSVWEYCNSINP